MAHTGYIFDALSWGTVSDWSMVAFTSITGKTITMPTVNPTPIITSSQFSWDSTMISALIAAAVSILVLAITIIRENRIRRKERELQIDDINKEQERQRNNLLRYLSSLVHGAAQQASKQIVVLKTYAEALYKNPYTFQPLHLVLKPDLEAIATKLAEETYFNSYVDQYKNIPSNVEEIKVIFSSATFINGQMDRLLDMSNRYYADESNKRQTFSQAMQEIIQILFDLQSKLGSTDTVFMKFFTLATFAFEEYNAKRTSPTNIGESYKLFILPLVELTSTEYATTTSIAPLITPLRTAKNSYYAIEIHCRSYLEEVRLIHKGLIEATKAMRNASNRVVKDYPIVTIHESATSAQ